MTELIYVHDFEIMSGFVVLAYLAILNGNFWAAVYINGLMQERRNSSALAMELRLPCINPSIWTLLCLKQVSRFQSRDK